ncbi:hypothetical protein Barb6XT_00081 [Bacteroidales bacterium Barb6XT]|nr:hypothetical protein Barb6XT_00939 [Bacteroidales bacterium Barb6XT]OAV68687.1 hypothetical protein Barb6XT_00862 [Bacteroidales bacterium Barb6XT]OAV70045.1 hypothetical protein Barb6XT_00081 [Bacteroidales bacterium Barb6XT]
MGLLGLENRIAINNSKMRETFILKSDWKSIFDDLSDKQAGMLIKMLFDYNVNGDKPANLSDLEIKMAFKLMAIDCDRFMTNYDRRCETSKNNGRKGGRPKKEDKQKTDYQNSDNDNIIDESEKPKKPNSKPKKPNNLTKPDNDNDKEKNIRENENTFSLGETSVSPPDSSNSEFDFENVWELYGKKGSRKISLSRWNALSKVKKRLATDYIPAYVNATPERRFRKNFETYISREAWNDELPVRSERGQPVVSTDDFMSKLHET